MGAVVQQLPRADGTVRLEAGHAAPVPFTGTVREGRAALWARDPAGTWHPLAELREGDVLPMPSDGAPWELRVQETVVLNPARGPETLAAARQLGEAHAARLGELHARVLVRRLLLSLLPIVCLYLAILGTPALWSGLADSALVSVPLQALFLVETVRFIRRSGLSLGFFGLTLEHGARAVAEGLALAVVLCAGMWGASLVLPALGSGGAPWSGGPLALAVGVYVVFAGVQELVVRGGVEPVLRIALRGPGDTAWALLIANALFALMHLHLSWRMAIVSFVIGCAWSALKLRHRTLLGVVVSHAVVGLFGFFVVGLR